MRYSPLLILFVLLTMSGCAPRKQAPSEARYDRHPFGIAAEVDDAMMVVSWKTAGQGLISGYNIYISEEPLLSDSDELPPGAEPHNRTVYAGDTDPHDEIEHYEASGLENGVLYYVHVRVVYPDRTLSPPTEEITAVCGPRGEIELAVRYQGKPDGFSFLRDDYVDADDVANDLYYFHRDGRDFLVAPSELGGFQRANRFRVLRVKGDLDQVSKDLPAQGPRPSDSRVEIARGDWIWIITPEEYHALVRIDGFTGTDEVPRVRLFYAFVPRSGAPIF